MTTPVPPGMRVCRGMNRGTSVWFASTGTSARPPQLVPEQTRAPPRAEAMFHKKKPDPKGVLLSPRVPLFLCVTTASSQRLVFEHARGKLIFFSSGFCPLGKLAPLFFLHPLPRSVALAAKRHGFESTTNDRVQARLSSSIILCSETNASWLPRPFGPLGPPACAPPARCSFAAMRLCRLDGGGSSRISRWLCFSQRVWEGHAWRSGPRSL